MIKIACIGDVGIDLYENLNMIFIGGIALNFAVRAKEEGADVTLISSIGENEAQRILPYIAKKGISTAFIDVRKGSTCKQCIRLEHGERFFCGYDPGVLTEFRLSKEVEGFLLDQDVVFCPLSDGMEPVFDDFLRLKTKGIKVADFSKDYNNFGKINLIELIKKVDVAFIGGDNNIAELILSHKPQNLVLVTLGANGCLLVKNGQVIQYPANKVTPIDTTGSGDCFQAVFLVNYLKEQNFHHALTKASAKAAQVAHHIGGMTDARLQ